METKDIKSQDALPPIKDMNSTASIESEVPLEASDLNEKPLQEQPNPPQSLELNQQSDRSKLASSPEKTELKENQNHNQTIEKEDAEPRVVAAEPEKSLEEQKAAWFPLKTQIIDENQQTYSVWMADGKRTYEGYPVYELVLENGKKMGAIHLKARDECVYINYMCSNYRREDRKNYTGIGTAILEYALHTSFMNGLEGHVELNAAWKSDGFHFKNGFRYKNSQEWAFGFSSKHVAPIVNKYLNNPTLESEEEFKKTKFYTKNQKRLVKMAKRQLDREPSDFKELLQHGFYLDRNKHAYGIFFNSDGTKKANPQELDIGGPMFLCEEARLEWKKRLGYNQI